MYNLHVVRILLPKVLGQEATMTIFGCFFGAEETAVVEIGNFVTLIDTTLGHQVHKDTFVLRPIDFSGTVVAEQFFRGSKVRDMPIANVSNLLEEIDQVAAFGKSCQLAAIANPHIHKRLHVVRLAQLQALLGGFLGESDGIKSDHTLYSSVSCW